MLRWLTSRPARSSASGLSPLGRQPPQTAAKERQSPQTEAKASRAGPAIAVYSTGRALWTPRDYAALARAGYMRNPVVHRAVRMISEAAASVPWLLYEGRREITEHPLLSLLSRPNTRQSGNDFLEAVYGFLLVSGNAYIEAVTLGDDVRELHALRPDRMTIVPDGEGWPAAFEYRANGQSVRFEQDGDGAIPPILHVMQFHPLDDHYGFPPLEAAQTSLDTHNAASFWNKALLDNAARPSGALVYEGRDGANLSEEQFERLRDELEANFQGAANAGRPLLLEGGLEWRAMSLSPQEMDFMEAKNGAAREIALAFGIPPMLLGIPGDNTYSNYKEANVAFWRQTVLPLVGRASQALGGWLGPAYGDGLRLWYDADQIPALSSERDALWARVQAVEFLSRDEKREAVGYGRAGQD
ncbi:phage portal protein, HK97 family [Faunimonas pinastri]|uniref:Phage portal protein, HK97 family n=1 Tax=Faunimonas pinastri TaxID=1855383 RepID=A0A1H9M977_9HYPH|nr:phage portal protein [Faunimonas pinastri]SER20131.1 phage portal protein, HK97 family [Faunimonas pinastri]